MGDQAEKLRKLIINKKKHYKKKKEYTSNNTRVITVTSGKGGVGKTNFTINLALSFCKLGYKVAVLDADIGFANIDVMLGIMPKYTLIDVIYNDKDILDIIEEGPYGLKIIPGGSGFDDIMRLDISQLNLLTNQLAKLEQYLDIIIIDTGAEISSTVINFISSSDEIILVITPELTSLTDGYAMLKVINNRVKKDSVKIVINRVKNQRESTEIFNKLNKASQKFLSLELDNMGYIYESKIVINSVKRQIPFILSEPKSNISKKVDSIAFDLINNKKTATNSGLKNFLDNIKSLVNLGVYYHE